MFETYPLLGELTGTLVPGVAEQLDHTLLIGSEAVRARKSVKMSLGEICAIKMTLCRPIRRPLVESGGGSGERHLPSNLLDDVADESGALAQVTLGAGDTGLDDAGGGFLHCGNRPIISFKVHRPRTASRRGGQRRDPPRGETGRIQRTWPLLMPTIRPERAVASLAILTEWLCDGCRWGSGEKSSVGRKSRSTQKVLGPVRRCGLRTLGRKVDCPIVGKERPMNGRGRLSLPCPDTPLLSPPVVLPTLTRKHIRVLWSWCDLHILQRLTIMRSVVQKILWFFNLRVYGLASHKCDALANLGSLGLCPLRSHSILQEPPGR